MKFNFSVILLAVFCGVLFAGIPEPDITLYGTVAVNNVPKGAGDNVTINARVSGIANPIASYQMGDNTAAGDNYVIKIAVDTLTDGSSQMVFLGTSIPAVGQTVTLYASENGGPEIEVGTFAISSRGEIQNLNLANGPFLDTDFNTDGKVNIIDFGNFALQWMNSNCDETNEWCDGKDFDMSNSVDIYDLQYFIKSWMSGTY